MGQLSSRRYEVRRVLGKGGMGVVYEAFDSRDRTVVALKTIDPRQAEHLYRLKHEFRALADVQHENIVRFGELSHEDGQWFFSMELVRGKNFLEYVRGFAASTSEDSARVEAATTILERLLPDSGLRRSMAPPANTNASFDEDRLRSALGQLVSALSAIHEAGHVHRDVKPSNVLVTDEGRVVLLDFGLVAALAGTTPYEDLDHVAGTPAFMAPEQIRGDAVGPDADWYAVGVILYLALTGGFPFDGSAAEILKAKIEVEPPPPRDRAPGVPSDLDALCVELLRRAPSQRPRADDIRARLRPNGGSSLGSVRAPAPIFVGREADVEVLSKAYADVRAGRGRSIVVEGEPGVGKSALVNHFLGRLDGSPIVLSGRCYEQESVPFKGLDSVVDALSEHLLTRDRSDTELLLAGGVRYLATIFPVLARVPAVAEALSEGRAVENETGLREQAFREFERLVDTLGAERPLVLFIDDLQWADPDSLALLRRVLLRPAGVPTLFVATLRAGAEVPGSAELLAAAERRALHGLDEAASRTLWSAVWPDGDPRSALTQRDIAVQETAGHPLFLTELARAARAGHADERHVRLEDVLWRRIQERDPVERRFLEMAALAGAPTPYDILAEAAELDPGECLTRLGGLKAAQLVRVTRRGDERLVEPYHDRVRESVAEHLARADAGSRAIARRHLLLGRALQAHTPEGGLPQRVFAILTHLDAARSLIATRAERLEVAELHLTASRAARLSTAYAQARVHTLEGLALVGETGWDDAYALTRSLSIARMEAEYLAGKAQAAREAFDTARRKLTALDDRASLYAAWIALESTHLRFDDALRAGREILRELGSSLPAHVTMAHVLAEFAANRLARGARSIDDLWSLPLLRDPAREGAMRILMALGPAAYTTDTTLFTWIMLHIAGVSMRHGVCNVSSYGFAGYGMVLAAAFGRRVEGAAFGRLALALNERLSNDALAGKLHFINASYLVVWTRPLTEARDALQRAYVQTVRSGDRAYEIYAVLHLTILTFFEGVNLATLQTTGERGQELSARRREADVSDNTNSILAHYAATLRGLSAPPLDFGLDSSPGAEPRTHPDEKSILTRFFYDHCRAEVAYLTGSADRAAELLEQAVSAGARAIFGTLMIVEVAWLEALIAARRFDGAPLHAKPGLLKVVVLRVAKLKRFAKDQPVSFEVHYLLALAELLRLGRRPAQARSAVERAVALAREQRAPKREAVGLDLAASYARRTGDLPRADALKREADDAYGRWGAVVLAARTR